MEPLPGGQGDLSSVRERSPPVRVHALSGASGCVTENTSSCNFGGSAEPTNTAPTRFHKEFFLLARDSSRGKRISSRAAPTKSAALEGGWWGTWTAPNNRRSHLFVLDHPHLTCQRMVLQPQSEHHRACRQIHRQEHVESWCKCVRTLDRTS